MAKILAVAHDTSMYGAQRSLFETVIALSKCGHTVTVATTTNGPLTIKLKEAGINTIELSFKWWIPPKDLIKHNYALRFLARWPRRVREITKHLRSKNYDVVYTNTITVADFAIAAKLSRIPHIWHIRESAANNPQLSCLLTNNLVGYVARNLSAAVIYNSRYLASRYHKKITEKEHVILNGLPEIQHDRVLRNLDNEKIKLITVGFMERRKGLDILLDALDRLPNETLMKISLDVIGDISPEYWKTEIEPRVSPKNGTVNLLGWADNIKPHLQSADILVSSARDEPFGRTLVEAMMMSIPIIATKSGGPQEIVVDGETGKLVEIDDISGLAKAIQELVESPDLRSKFGDAGNKRARSIFSVERYISEINTCINRAIANK